MLKKLLAARWFPTVTKPLLTGLVASAVVVGLRALGITDVVPAEVNAIVAPLVGFLIAAIVQAGHSPSPSPTPAPGEVKPSIGSQVAHLLISDIGQAIDANPALVHELASKALAQALASTTDPAHLPQT